MTRTRTSYALTGEPIDLPYHTSAQVDMSREQARRWCAEAYRARIEERAAYTVDPFRTRTRCVYFDTCHES